MKTVRRGEDVLWERGGLCVEGYSEGQWTCLKSAPTRDVRLIYRHPFLGNN